MVYYKDLAWIDLLNILDGLIGWQTANGEKHLTRAQVFQYVRDIKRAFDTIDQLLYHRKAVYELHQQHGEYVYQYRRNARTSWYACYDKTSNAIFVNHITNNYLTIS